LKKIENYFSFEMLKEKFGSICKEIKNFLPKKLSLSSQKYGVGILDPGSGKNLFRIPDPGVKKAPDPRSGSATLVGGNWDLTQDSCDYRYGICCQAL
jgi:hypothetical protein